MNRWKKELCNKTTKMTDTFLNWKELSISIVQGLIITAGVLVTYQYAIYKGGNEENTRAMVFSTLIFANIFLSLVNRSFNYSIFEIIKYKNKLFPIIISATLLMLLMILYNPPFANFIHLESLTWSELLMTILFAILSVFWFEIYKWFKRKRMS